MGPKKGKPDNRVKDPFRISGPQAYAEAKRIRKQKLDLDQMFGDADSFGQLMAYLVGAASVCWDKAPRGEFDTEMANRLVDAALKRTGELIEASVGRAYDMAASGSAEEELADDYGRGGHE